jgi:hypothetical protein
MFTASIIQLCFAVRPTAVGYACTGLSILFLSPSACPSTVLYNPMPYSSNRVHHSVYTVCPSHVSQKLSRCQCSFDSFDFCILSVMICFVFGRSRVQISATNRYLKLAHGRFLHEVSVSPIPLPDVTDMSQRLGRHGLIFPSEECVTIQWMERFPCARCVLWGHIPARKC